MTDALSPVLAQLAEAKGVSTTWWDWHGQQREVPATSVRAVLTALGEDATDDEAAGLSLDEVRDRPWRRTLPPTVIHRAGRTYQVLVHVPHGSAVAVRVDLEDGGSRPLEQARHDVDPRTIDGTSIGEAAFVLPADLPLGWHRLVADTDAAPLDPRSTTATLAVVPEKLRLPAGAPLTGLLTQLYQVRSRRSWGIGDLGDLARLGEWAVDAYDAGFVVVNPLHAAEPCPPIEPSPYLPTSRRFVNPIYIDLGSLPGADRLSDATRAEIDALAERGQALTGDEVIDRDAIWTLKDEALRAAFRELGEGQAEDVARLHAVEGEALVDLATWCSIAMAHGTRWRQWPTELHDPRSPEVLAHRERHREEISYQVWLQWVVQTQLAHAQQRLQEAGMPLGIVGDLAVGIHAEGAERWALGDVFAHGVTVGAPPDQFNQLGQDWSQPPWRPDRLAEAGYAPFRDMIRAVLRAAGGLRVDHIIGLFRLWWVPEGGLPVDGAYVRYDHEAMIGILALEAERAGAVVIGEDLGVVEPWVREYLTERGVLGTSVVWFERDEQGEPLPPERYRELCLATVTTHDLPPSTGYLQLEHVDVRQRLGLLTRPEEQERAAEQESIDQVRRALAARDLLPREDAPVAEVVDALHRWLELTPSRLRGLALTDLVGDVRAVNQPGTSTEYPNWRLPLAGPDRQPLLLEDLIDGDTR